MLDEDHDLQVDSDLMAMKPVWHVVDVLGLVTGLVPFVLSYSQTTSTSVSTSGGGLDVGTTTVSHMDYVALGGGGVTLLLAVIGLALIGRMRSRSIRLAIFIVLLALGSFQIIRGVLADTGATSSSGMLS